MIVAARALVLAPCTFCFVAFAWALRGHFRPADRLPRGMAMMNLASAVAFAWFVWRAAAMPLSPAWPGVPLLAFAAFALFAATVAATRQTRLTLAFSPDTPAFVLRRGPYRWIRHPFYTSYMLFWTATALASRGAAPWIVPAGLLGAYWTAARREEAKFAHSALNAQYAAYSQATGMFMPRWHGWRRAPSARRKIRDAESTVTGRFASCKNLLGWASVASSPPGIAARIRVGQMDMLSWLTLVMALAGINTLAAICIAFGPAVLHGARAVAVFLIPATYATVITAGFIWRRQREPQASVRRFLRGFTTATAVLGVLWGVLLAGLVPMADAGQRSMLYGVAVGMISTAVLFAPVSVAFAFWIPVTASGFVSLLPPGHPVELVTALCLLGYSFLTFFCIIYLNRKLIDRVLHEVRLEEQGEVIALLLRDFEENSNDWPWEIDEQLRLSHVPARLAQVTGRPAGELLGCSLQALLSHGSAAADLREPLRRLTQRLADRAAFRDFTFPVLVGGEQRWWSLTGKPLFDSRGNFTGYRGIGCDVTAAKQSEERVHYLARFDSLTDLPNRVLFSQALEQACALLPQHSLAVLCLDLDQFKNVNDTMGHATGDALLAAVADRLRGCIRGGDVAARLGGDEFAIILHACGKAEAASFARRITQRISQPYRIDGLLLEIGVSIGITFAPADGTVPSALLRNADLAMYRAKADGRNTWRFFEAEMEQRLQQRRALQADMRHALGRNEFRLEFQPIVDLHSTRIVAAEALLRWAHPQRGLISSADFIPIAEEAGLIGPIGEWVLQHACQEASRWPDHVKVSVNLSPMHFRDVALPSMLARVLNESGLSPLRLELELTESVLLENSEQTLDSLRRLRESGVRLALDDFGTGYSSLSYLRSFPFDTLKIDRSFIHDLGADTDADAIVRAISGMAHSMGIVTTAEGIETAEQVSVLKAAGCMQGQGYFFGRPRAVLAFEATLAPMNR